MTEGKPAKPRFSAYRVVGTALAVDLIDILTNGLVAFFTGSVVLLAEMFQGIADLSAVLAVWFGLERAKRPADAAHPFGYGRELYFWNFIATLIMAFVLATLSFYLGYQRFLHPQPVEHIEAGLFVLLLAVTTNGYSFTLSMRRIFDGGKRQSAWRRFTNSPYIESKTTFILDLTGTLAGAAGLLALGLYLATGDARFDGIGAMAIGLIMAGFSVVLLTHVKELLIGRSAPRETLFILRKTAESVEGVNSVLDMKTFLAGPDNLVVNMEIHAANDLTTDDLERVIDQVKADIIKAVPETTHVQVELETPRRRRRAS
ncbi:cation diffusion facilitator family transporter [Candidatus Berkelbacteria bacterium]|nr:cation diffusion facilitator family transporter [Candidatus Berkelbacteria bacterium]